MDRVSIGSDNGLSPIRRQAIIWNNAGILSIGPLGTNFSEILIKIQNLSFTKMHLKGSSAKWQPFCPGEDELMTLRGVHPLLKRKCDNSFVPGKSGCDFKNTLSNFVLLIMIFKSYDNTLRWMLHDLIDDKPTLVRWHQATNYYLSQCWPSSASRYSVTRSQKVNWSRACISVNWLIIAEVIACRLRGAKPLPL